MTARASQEHPHSSRLDTKGDRIIRQARSLLDHHLHFHGHLDAIQVEYVGGHLVLQGQVPTFYLKQVLQAVLRDLPEVEQIENRVDVVSPCGLSSVKKNYGEEQHEQHH